MLEAAGLALRYVTRGFEVEARFDPTKDEAYNFFYTCMHAWCQCNLNPRRIDRYSDLKRKYQDYRKEKPQE